MLWVGLKKTFTISQEETAMLVQLSKQELLDLEALGEFLDKTGTFPKLWIHHTEFGIVKDRYKKVVEKLKERHSKSTRVK